MKSQRKILLTTKTIFQFLLLVATVLLIAEGLWGNPFAPKNLATQFVWVHYRGILVFILLLLGNYFCMSCPFIFVRNALRVFHSPKRLWPKKLQNKWLGTFLLVAFLFAYEYFHLWSSPALTAWIIIIYFLVAVFVDLTFKKASFCKYLCPIGQFNFISSTMSPATVKAKNLSVCESCTTYECLKGVEKDGEILKRGCETFLFIPKKNGNLDCTFCMDCVAACPYDNVKVEMVINGEELQEDSPRAGIGSLTKRLDFLLLIVVFTFGALLNAFAMTGPAYDLTTTLSDVTGIQNNFVLLLSLFVTFLIFLPLLLISKKDYKLITTLLPIGFFIWVSHYSFHLLTGLFAFVPLLFKIQLSNSMMGMPTHIVTPIQYGFLLLGFLGSMTLVWTGKNEKRAKVKWSATHLAIFLFALWVMSLPMEMRGTFVGIAP